MKINNWIVVGIAVLIFLFGAFISKIVGDKKLDRLKFVADSIATVAQTDSLAATRFSDSIKVVVNDLQARKNKVIRVAIIDSLIVDSLKEELKSLPTIQDSVDNLLRTVVVQDSQIQAERGARIFAEAQAEAQAHRADSLQNTVGSLTNMVTSLRDQIKELHPQLPKLVRYSIKGIALGGAFYAGIKYGQNHP